MVVGCLCVRAHRDGQVPCMDAVTPGLGTRTNGKTLPSTFQTLIGLRNELGAIDPWASLRSIARLHGELTTASRKIGHVRAKRRSIARNML